MKGTSLKNFRLLWAVLALLIVLPFFLSKAYLHSGGDHRHPCHSGSEPGVGRGICRPALPLPCGFLRDWGLHLSAANLFSLAILAGPSSGRSHQRVIWPAHRPPFAQNPGDLFCHYHPFLRRDHDHYAEQLDFPDQRPRWAFRPGSSRSHPALRRRPRSPSIAR